MKNKAYIRFAWATLLVLFLVIIAGSVVRMTGSGMGCPDWPKCFGHLIPPTEKSQVMFQPNTPYHQGQMILHQDKLLVAQQDMITEEKFDADDWSVYEQHDYAVFNAAHTWTEYINRLLGAISGLFVLALFGFTIKRAMKQETSWWATLLAFIILLLLGFQAWLGKTVVDSNLASAKITAHMFGAMALIAAMLILIRSAYKSVNYKLTGSSFFFLILAMILLLVQIYLGTEFRAVVDEFDPLHHGEQYHSLFQEQTFKVHRSFAWLVLLSAVLFIWSAASKNGWHPLLTVICLMLLSEVGIGIIMTAFDFPLFTQPLHLLIACGLFACYTWLLVSSIRIEV